MLAEKHGNGGEKMRKGGQQGENERQCRKKNEQEHDKESVSIYDIFQHKVSHCSRAKQRQRNVKKSVLWICKVVVVAFFFANREEKSLRHVAIVDQTTNQKRHLTK